jgi:hypothetical protein
MYSVGKCPSSVLLTPRPLMQAVQATHGSMEYP